MSLPFHVLFFLLLCSCLLSLLRGLNYARLDQCVCNVSDDQTVSNCKSRRLCYIPTCITSQSEVIILSENTFFKLVDHMFLRFRFLRTLYLDRCRIRSISGGAFHGLFRLKVLVLKLNNLKYQYLPNDAFKPLINLRELWLSGNCHKLKEHCKYPKEVLKHLQKLNYLDIDGLPNEKLGDSFSSLKQLKSLEMTSTAGSYCYLPFLNETSFEGLKTTSITSMKLNLCNIKSIETNVFKGLNNLATLEISNNYDLCGYSLKNLSTGLNTTSIRTLKITCWCRKFPPDLILDDLVSTELSGTKLEYLEISDSHITYIPSSFLAFLPTTLKTMFFRKNRLMHFDSFKNLSRFERLEELNLDYQVNYPSKNLEASKRTKQGTNQYKESAVSFVQILLPASLKHLSARKISNKISIGKITFLENNLEIINLSDSHISKISGPVYGLQRLKALDLANNIIKCMTSSVFRQMPRLLRLNLQGNLLGRCSYIDENMFRNLTLLEELNLSENSINDLPVFIFSPLKSLRTLLLRNNNLLSVQFEFSALHNLRLLDISQNKIFTMSPQNLEFLHLNSLNVLIHENPFLCTCRNQNIVQWIISVEEEFQFKSLVTCQYENNTFVNYSMFKQAINQLKVDCNVDAILVSSGVAIFISISLIFLVAVFYHKHWQITYLLHISKKSLYPYHPIEQNTVCLKTDVYISYDIDHVVDGVNIKVHDFVTADVIPYLHANGFTAKIREDITPGRRISSEIVNTLRHCKKVIVFLSSQYTDDYWNNFEFNMAVMEGIYTKRNVIILVLIERLDKKKLSTDVATFVHAKIQENNVLQVTKETFVNKNLFLDKLNEELRD